ncbi:hypothetical protein RHSIM_Rhsim03G0037200 [Rhododendron simsii]|uniref:DRBM domain-containing protein n=1 Tax=Rhododendron simsii TaxID=118357 RepID=A0A834H8Z5_RHOSS|nr:hypothetical protein RHSIM_Rhsim03G0037200 [Rhododendron simsii]
MVHHSRIISPQPAVAEHLNKPVPNQPNRQAWERGAAAHDGQQQAAVLELPYLGERQLYMYKNRLQEFTQRLGLPFPMYQTTNEGSQHAPRFRSTVIVDGSSYTSTGTFLHRKAAEQDSSRVALDGLAPKMKDEGFLFKMNLEMPTYTTIQLGGVLPVFESNLLFNGATYNGGLAKSKREAEQLAARAVIQSIMGNSDSSEVTDSNNAHNEFMPAAVNPGASSSLPRSKGKELEGTGCTNSIPTMSIPKTCSGQLRNAPATFQFKKPKFEPSSCICTSIQQSLGVGSSFAKERNCKNKKAKGNNPT